MKDSVALEKCAPFIRSQNSEAIAGAASTTLPAVTISRECGSGGHTVAELLSKYLQVHALPGTPGWTILDRNLMEEVLHDLKLPERIARFAPEDRTSPIGDVLDELLGIRPSAWTLAQQTAATILRLVNHGHVIVVGRAANMVTQHLPHVFRVRLVGSLAKRCLRIQELYGLSQTAALRFIAHEDRGRKRYLQQHFGKDADDVAGYDLLINTDFISYERAAQLIGDEVMLRSSAFGASLSGPALDRTADRRTCRRV
jgi:cytidylate kinase